MTISSASPRPDPAATTTTRHAAAPTAGTPDSARCVQSGESGAPTLAAAPPTTLLFSLSLSLSLSPALKPQTTGAPPPAPLPPPHPPLPARLANCLEVPRTLGALPYKPSPHDTRLRAQRPDNRRSGILHRAPPPLEESLYYTTDHIPPAPRYARSRSTRRPLDALGALRSPPPSVSVARPIPIEFER